MLFLYLSRVDLGNIVYIVAILAYFIYQATRGKKKNQVPVGDDGRVDEPTDQPTSFEDVLREIRNSQKPKQVTAKPPQPVKERPGWRQDPVVKKRFPTGSVVKADEEISYYKGAFENVKSELNRTSKGVPEIPSLKETTDISPQRKHHYAAMLKNPQSVRDAVVLKEILDKKYF